MLIFLKYNFCNQINSKKLTIQWNILTNDDKMDDISNNNNLKKVCKYFITFIFLL